MDAYIVDFDIFALVVHGDPVGGIAEGDIVDFHILTLSENQQSGTESLANTVVAQLVFHEAFVYEVGAIVAQFSPLSFDDATTVIHPDKADVFDAFGENEAIQSMANWMLRVFMVTPSLRMPNLEAL